MTKINAIILASLVVLGIMLVTIPNENIGRDILFSLAFIAGGVFAVVLKGIVDHE